MRTVSQFLIVLILLTAGIAVGRYWGALVASPQSKVTADSHAGHVYVVDEFPKIALPDEALKNIGIITEDGVVNTQEYESGNEPKTQSFAGILTDMPGRSVISVSPRISGRIQKMYYQNGDSVKSGELLFDMQIIDSEVEENQSELLSLLAKHFVNRDKRKNYNLINQSHLTTQLQFEIRELDNECIDFETKIAAKKSALLLHGLSTDDVKALENQFQIYLTDSYKKILEQGITEGITGLTFEPENLRRFLVTKITLKVPYFSDTLGTHHNPNEPANRTDIRWVLENLTVKEGQLVSAGDTLCQVSDLSQLRVEGSAYSIDESVIQKVCKTGNNVKIRFSDRNNESTDVSVSEIKVIDSRIDTVNRVFHFYAVLDNVPVKDEHNHSPEQQHAEHLHWKYRPGQRCNVIVETENVEDCIKLPSSAVAQEGQEYFVFRQNDESHWYWKAGQSQFVQLNPNPEDEKDADQALINTGKTQLRKNWERVPVRVLFQNENGYYVEPTEDILGLPLVKTGTAQLNDALNSGSGKLQSSCPCGEQH
ncbi:hypothetical protein FACS189443_2240 [Planctomycetales bacterium]|nr:hypothetical protein FACS189443_2240 [Planctomycetales bacterium]